MELLPPTHESSSERLFLTFHPSESTRSTSSTTKIYNWQSLRVHHSWSYRFLHRSYCAVSVATQCRRRMEARIHGFSNYWAISQHFLLGTFLLWMAFAYEVFMLYLSWSGLLTIFSLFRACQILKTLCAIT